MGVQINANIMGNMIGKYVSSIRAVHNRIRIEPRNGGKKTETGRTMTVTINQVPSTTNTTTKIAVIWNLIIIITIIVTIRGP